MAYSKLANPHATREVLEAFGLEAKYSLGQNFLIDDNVIGRILDLSGLSSAEERPCIVEVGPGVGTLTVALLDHANVISVETDADLPQVLAFTCKDHAGEFALIEGDALKVTSEQLEIAAQGLGCEPPRELVSNLPYAVAATLILDWFERFEQLDAMTVMVQSEVADRIAARMGTKNYGAYSVKLRMHAQVTGRFQVAPTCFFPAPRVESAVIRLEKAPLHEDTRVIEVASRLADAAFAQRRKNIRNSMQTKYERDVVDALLAACSIDPKRRGETLSPEDYLAMAEELLRLS